MTESRKQKHQKCTRSRSVNTVIYTDYDRNDHAFKNQHSINYVCCIFLISFKRVAPQNIKQNYRQHDQHGNLQNALRNQKCQMRTHPGTGNRTKNSRNTDSPLHKAFFHVVKRRYRSPHKAAHFICCNCGMYRQPRDHICRKRDQSASSGNRIYKSCQKYKKTYYQIN